MHKWRIGATCEASVAASRFSTTGYGRFYRWLLLCVILLSFTGCSVSNRANWQQPERVVESLSVTEGAVIADIGSGDGYFTFRFADATGPAGKVYAVDISATVLAKVAERAESESYSQVATVQAGPSDPMLPRPVDIVFVCNTYHHLTDRTDYFRNVKNYLSPGGRVAIIDFDDLPWWGNLMMRSHQTAAATIREEMEQAGYYLVEEHDFLPYQNFLIFAVADSDRLANK
ncbi:class I SAM-dependent methyltransferase [Alkalilimnicola ehrlichii]|nr:methyltransferase domain-containing protein [Alkalilimnicola ehrlichii]